MYSSCFKEQKKGTECVHVVFVILVVFKNKEQFSKETRFFFSIKKVGIRENKGDLSYLTFLGRSWS